MLSEVGSKDANGAHSSLQMDRINAKELDAWFWKVITAEAREGGNVGIYREVVKFVQI